MACIQYDTNKWDCTISFINRDYLDPLIAEQGLKIFDRTRWGVVENLYQRVKGEYRAPEGCVITGIGGVLAMLSDYSTDPKGSVKIKTFYRLTHVYVSKLVYIYKYDGSWEQNTTKVMITGATELGDRWESSQNPFEQKFIRGYFLSGVILKQGFLGDVGKVMLTNAAITFYAKHFKTGETLSYSFGSPTAGTTKDAGLVIPDLRVISGFKFDCSIITFTPFYEITNLYIKDIKSELPIDPAAFSAPIVGPAAAPSVSQPAVGPVAGPTIRSDQVAATTPTVSDPAAGPAGPSSGIPAPNVREEPPAKPNFWTSYKFVILLAVIVAAVIAIYSQDDGYPAGFQPYSGYPEYPGYESPYPRYTQ